jgi:C_GCAxxG_C_C family probable redox protein
MKSVSRAVDLFRGGCACSQAILAAYGPRYGLGESQALRVAAGFAGGMRMAETCGAVTGAYMVLGLAKCDGGCGTAEGRKGTYDALTAFSKAFRERQGDLKCRDLLGCDISTPEGAAAAREANLFRTRCVDLVRCAAEILDDMLPAGRLAAARKEGA